MWSEKLSENCGNALKGDKPFLLLAWNFNLCFSGHEIAGSPRSLRAMASFRSLRGEGKGIWGSLEYLHFCQDATPQPRLCPEQLAKRLLVELEAFVMSKDKIKVPVKDSW